MGKITNFAKAYNETRRDFYNPHGEKPLFIVDDTGKTFICPVCGMKVPTSDDVPIVRHADGWVAHYDCVFKISKRIGGLK
jgi:hypothetical protein